MPKAALSIVHASYYLFLINRDHLVSDRGIGILGVVGQLLEY